MLFRATCAIWLMMSSSLFAEENVCSPTEEAAQELAGFPFIDDVNGAIAEKWIITSSRIYDFAADGTVFMAKTGSSDDVEGRKRWKGRYSVEEVPDGNMLCFPSNMESTADTHCAFMSKSADNNFSSAGKLIFPCEVDGTQGFEIVGITVSERGKVFGRPHPLGKDRVRNGDFQNGNEADSNEVQSKPNARLPSVAGYKEIEIIDAKIDLEKLSNQKIIVEGNLMLVGDVGALTNPSQDADFDPIFVDLETLPRDDRRYVYKNCQLPCRVKVAGVVTKDFTESDIISALKIIY